MAVPNWIRTLEVAPEINDDEWREQNIFEIYFLLKFPLNSFYFHSSQLAWIQSVSQSVSHGLPTWCQLRPAILCNMCSHCSLARFLPSLMENWITWNYLFSPQVLSSFKSRQITLDEKEKLLSKLATTLRVSKQGWGRLRSRARIRHLSLQDRSTNGLWLKGI